MWYTSSASPLASTQSPLLPSKEKKGVEIVKLLLFYSYWKIIKWAIKLLTFCFFSVHCLFSGTHRLFVEPLNWAIQGALYEIYAVTPLSHLLFLCFLDTLLCFQFNILYFMCTTVGWNSSCHKINLRSNSHKYNLNILPLNIWNSNLGWLCLMWQS